MRIKVSCDAPIPKNWQNFLCDSDNKTTLFGLIADTLQSLNPFIVAIFLTKQDTVLSNQSSDLSLISPCIQEEADTPVLLHVSNCNGTSVIKTVDSDVIVICIGNFFDMNIDELWVDFGTEGVLYYPIHDIAHELEPTTSKGILFFHAFTGCDTVSSFFYIGKTPAWNV